MTTPIEAIADALLAFILTLLRDPDAAAEFAADPAGGLADQNLETACMRDLAAVRPVIVDRPDIVARTQPNPVPPRTEGDTEVTREIIRMVQQFSTTTIDARSTIVDNSVNQSIWTGGGDVTQIFDQEAIIASGDGSVAAGHDGTIVDSDLDVTIGDIAIGNETTEGSFNGTGAPPVDAPPAPVEPTAPLEPAAPVVPADVAEPADVLEADMTAETDSYDADAASAAAAEQPVVDEPIEEE
ncbi:MULTISPECIES: IniB N-terminal domain-containing protein [unclassified Microbacterium]|uniref:IniB N-terminal domain-containing protein n=1 Tax=unclassified Microbacterium TaxID=2609290 RepID=UPI00344122D1